MKYKTIRTTTGNKIRVRMSDEEVAARTLYRMAVVIMPLIASMLMTFVWVKMG